MKVDARLVTESHDAKSVSESIEADNAHESIYIRTYESDGMLISDVRSDRFPTVIATVDELIRCQIMAESLI